MTNNKIKVIVVDDSPVMRKAVTRILEQDPGIEVLDSAENGLDALNKVKRLQPDVITLDIDMPVMNGITTIRHLMIESPVPIVVLSSLITDGAVTFDALRLGVADFVPKPSGDTDLKNSKIGHQLIDRVKIACSMQLENVRRVRLPKKWNVKDRLEKLYRFYPLEYIIVIGTTLSGPNTVIRLLSMLSPTIPAAVVVLQEISPKIISSFVQKFDEHVTWKVEVAADKRIVEQGTCYIGSDETSLRLEMNEKGEISLICGDRRDYPLNLLFSSSAKIFHQNTVGILLSGLGDDGTEGFAEIKKESGITMVKDVQCCVFPNLTDHAVRAGVVDIVSDDHKLADAIESFINTN